MGCNRCHEDECCCRRVLEATNVDVVVGATMTITVIPDQQFRDFKVYILEIPQSLPPRIGTEVVSIKAGATTYYCLDRAGNTLRSGRLRGHKECCHGNPYRIIFGSDGNVGPGLHFEFLEGLCPMEFSASPALLDPFSVTTDNTVTL